MTRIAILGNCAVDRIDGQAATAGGCPSFAARALGLLGREGLIVTRYAAADRALFEPALAALGAPVTTLTASCSNAFGFRYDGEERTMTVDAIGVPWSPADLAALGPDVRWVHVAPLLRSDFPPETLAALAGGGRRVSYDGQGLVRVPRLGPLLVDAGFDPALLAPLTVLKLAVDEAAVLCHGAFGPADATRLGVPEVLVTDGSHGCVVHADGRAEHVPAAWPVLGVQTTGAGDVFMVGYVAARSDGAAPVEAARVGSELVARMLTERQRAAGS